MVSTVIRVNNSIGRYFDDTDFDFPPASTRRSTVVQEEGSPWLGSGLRQADVAYLSLSFLID